MARDFNPFLARGVVEGVSGVGVDISDRLGLLDIGARIEIETSGEPLAAEVVGLSEGRALALPFGALDGVRRGADVKFFNAAATTRPSRQWLGRIVNGLGAPIDGGGAIGEGPRPYRLRAAPPPAPLRARLGGAVDFGVSALNAFAAARVGQRLGVFAGSGVGKSALLSMIARNTDCDVRVIALIGERGREVREFIEDSLGAEGLARSVVIAATSDEPAMMRREAAYLAMTMSEYFRDEGAHVMCLMDSITRVAAAQREIGIAAGEPPASRGFPPSVFSLLPKLLERAGTGVDRQDKNDGAVTGVFSVLVEGDDHDEPVADASRAILDGHIVLDRRIAERGRFPAVDILKTVSRMALDDIDPERAALVNRARRLASIYEDMRELIRIGAYQSGSNADVDRAVAFQADLDAFLTQARDAAVTIDQTFAALAQILAAVEVGGAEDGR
ncbi:MAG: FliI/YscN family ATPase [Pseudomonadota bacterium]